MIVLYMYRQCLIMVKRVFYDGNMQIFDDGKLDFMLMMTNWIKLMNGKMDNINMEIMFNDHKIDEFNGKIAWIMLMMITKNLAFKQIIYYGKIQIKSIFHLIMCINDGKVNNFNIA